MTFSWQIKSYRNYQTFKRVVEHIICYNYVCYLGGFDSILVKHGFIEWHETTLSNGSTGSGLDQGSLPLEDKQQTLQYRSSARKKQVGVNIYIDNGTIMLGVKWRYFYMQLSAGIIVIQTRHACHFDFGTHLMNTYTGVVLKNRLCIALLL